MSGKAAKGSPISRRDHFAQVEKSLKRKPKELLGAPDLPEAAAYLWHAYVDLRNSSQGPIAYTEIEAFIRLTGNTLTPAEINVIRQLDVIYLKEAAKS